MRLLWIEHSASRFHMIWSGLQSGALPSELKPLFGGVVICWLVLIWTLIRVSYLERNGILQDRVIGWKRSILVVKVELNFVRGRTGELWELDWLETKVRGLRDRGSCSRRGRASPLGKSMINWGLEIQVLLMRFQGLESFIADILILRMGYHRCI